MPDYGHVVQFGSFITPTHRNAAQVVAAAQAAERLGLDLVTIQDHPYQPAFLDTWTLLGYLGAATARIRLAGNVLNLPLRPPAQLAKAVASLDLLTGGRIELGLGAGAFWDGIAAMGGRRLSPAQAVDALSDAIDVIHGIWDVEERGNFRMDGPYYRIPGAPRGPAPAHPVGIWLGAYRLPMLQLVGHKADGWLPALGRLTPRQIVDATAIIDDAAVEAGRDPAEVIRIANVPIRFASTADGLVAGPATHWVEQLTDLAMRHGFSTFIVAGDDTADYARIADEVMPRVREAIAAERRGRRYAM